LKDLVEQKRRSAAFHYPIGDFGDLQLSVDRMGDALELTLAL
jgi:hypothetical protein